MMDTYKGIFLKSMQDMITQYDGTVCDGTDIVQFWYGRDNSDNSKI